MRTDPTSFFGGPPRNDTQRAFWAAHSALVSRSEGGPETWDEAVEAGFPKYVSSPLAPIVKLWPTHGEALVPHLEAAISDLGLSTYSKTSLRKLVAAWRERALEVLSDRGERYDPVQGAKPTGDGAIYRLREPQEADLHSIIGATYSQYEHLDPMLSLLQSPEGEVVAGDGGLPMWQRAYVAEAICLKFPRNLIDAATWAARQSGSYVRSGEEQQHLLAKAFDQSWLIYVCERWATGVITVRQAPEDSRVLLSSPAEIDVSSTIIAEDRASNYHIVMTAWKKMCSEGGQAPQSKTFGAYLMLYGAHVVEQAMARMEDLGQGGVAHLIPRHVATLYHESPHAIAQRKVLERIELLASVPTIDLRTVIANG